jgi:uncharacterized repeat protein (TIGR01451 family)
MNQVNRFRRAQPIRLTLALLAMSLLLHGVAFAAAESSPVSIVTQAVVEKKVATEEGHLVMQRIPATKVLPGDTVIFVNTVTNNSDSAAEDVAVSNPIPASMLFVNSSSAKEKTAITFSVNGGVSFDRPERLKVLGNDGKPRPATPADYTDIRWLFTTPLPANAAEQVEFQTQVK